MASSNEAPDSWEEDPPVQSTSTALSGLQLRADAPSFVPGKNVFAVNFVPSGAPAPQLGPPPPPPGEPEPYYSDAPPTAGEPGEAPTEDPPEVAPWEANKDIRPPEVCPISEPADSRSYADSPAPTDSPAPELTTELDEEAVPGAKQVSKRKKPVVVVEDHTKKEHVNIVFIGHVDAGKSTIGGRVLQATGMVDQRTLEKYEKEAKEKNRETWYLSWALDTNNEERDKGKTVEVGRAYFETDARHFTILDAPGHRSFVPNMIGGASQADIAVLVISARRGEFETGFERGGQTQEHAMLVKTAGVKQLIMLINKMDDPTVQWNETRYNECKDKLLPYLKKLGYNPLTDIKVIPCSGLTGAFIKYAPPDAATLAPWYTGPTFLDYLESLPTINRASEGPVRIPIVDKYRDMGTIALGKVESGHVNVGARLIIMPNKKEIEVSSIWSDDIETSLANAGENIKLKLKGVKEEVKEDDILSGFVICSPSSLCSVGRVFDAQVVVLEHKSIICAGYGAVLHFHTGAEEVVIKNLIALVDRKGNKTPRPRFIKQDQIAIVRLQLTGGIICLETYKDFPQMGRFTLRDEGRTIAVGKVLKIIQ